MLHTIHSGASCLGVSKKKGSSSGTGPCSTRNVSHCLISLANWWKNMIKIVNIKPYLWYELSVPSVTPFEAGSTILWKICHVGVSGAGILCQASLRQTLLFSLHIISHLQFCRPFPIILGLNSQEDTSKFWVMGQRHGCCQKVHKSWQKYKAH